LKLRVRWLSAQKKAFTLHDAAQMMLRDENSKLRSIAINDALYNVGDNPLYLYVSSITILTPLECRVNGWQIIMHTAICNSRCLQKWSGTTGLFKKKINVVYVKKQKLSIKLN
jgi:hypothetical protein